VCVATSQSHAHEQPSSSRAVEPKTVPPPLPLLLLDIDLYPSLCDLISLLGGFILALLLMLNIVLLPLQLFLLLCQLCPLLLMLLLVFLPPLRCLLWCFLSTLQSLPLTVPFVLLLFLLRCSLSPLRLLPLSSSPRLALLMSASEFAFVHSVLDLPLRREIGEGCVAHRSTQSSPTTHYHRERGGFSEWPKIFSRLRVALTPLFAVIFRLGARGFRKCHSTETDRQTHRGKKPNPQTPMESLLEPQGFKRDNAGRTGL
jgi:hypothetical protein